MLESGQREIGVFFRDIADSAAAREEAHGEVEEECEVRARW